MHFSLTQDQVCSFWRQGTRPDGRHWMQVRPTTVVPDILSTAAGSALVRLGDTHVTGSLSWQIGQPVSSSSAASGSGSTTTTAMGTSMNTTTAEQQGDVLVQIERSGQYGSGATTFTALEGWVQRLLTDTLDLTQLSIRPGWAWRAVVCLHVLQDAGSLRDAALLAAVAAWHNARLPIDLVEKQGKFWVKPNGNTKRLLTENIPISLTLGHWRENGQQRRERWMIDPTTDEEGALDGRLTLTVVGGALWGIEWDGECVDFAEQIPMWQALAVERAKEVQGLLEQ